MMGCLSGEKPEVHWWNWFIDTVVGTIKNRMGHKRTVEVQKKLCVWVKLKIIKQWAKKNPISGCGHTSISLAPQNGFPRMGLEVYRKPQRFTVKTMIVSVHFPRVWSMSHFGDLFHITTTAISVVSMSNPQELGDFKKRTFPNPCVTPVIIHF